MTVRNVTVSVSDDLYRTARIRAAELDTTVTGLVRAYLESLAPYEEEFRRLQRLQDEALDRLAASDRAVSGRSRLSREEVHDRGALRRAHARDLRA